jgi:tetratricopeptide (TPR) repeat protein
MNRQSWIGALRRLNELVERHPADPAVHRGHAMIHLRQYVADRNRMTLDAALRSIDKALLLDPREIRTYFDAAQVAQAAGDMKSALRHLQKALSFELVGDGAAARRLADMLLALGQQALDDGEAGRVGERGEDVGKRRHEEIISDSVN